MAAVRAKNAVTVGAIRQISQILLSSRIKDFALQEF
jgi:hypothetical protein